MKIKGEHRLPVVPADLYGSSLHLAGNGECPIAQIRGGFVFSRKLGFMEEEEEREY